MLALDIPFEGPHWQDIDPLVIDLIKHMLKYDQNDRYSIH